VLSDKDAKMAAAAMNFIFMELQKIEWKKRGVLLFFFKKKIQDGPLYRLQWF
jgi:hypothetical protein